MKTLEKLNAALSVKEKQLADNTKKLEEVDAWIKANNVFGTNSEITFLEKLLTEKVDIRTRQFQLQAQVDFLLWVLK